MTEHPRVLPHGDIEDLATGVYRVQGSAVMGPGIRIPRNMAIVVHDRVVTVINAVRLDAAGEKRLAELGEVKHVVKIRPPPRRSPPATCPFRTVSSLPSRRPRCPRGPSS